MNNFLILSLIGFLLIPVIPVDALPRDADLVVTEINIDPPYPNKGDPVTITADIYNAGFRDTKSYASIITVAYFVDDVLLHVDEIGNIEPGITNKLQTSSPPIWKSDLGPHTVKVIADYHDTLNDQYDSPLDNTLEQLFVIDDLISTSILLDISPAYLTPEFNVLTITAILVDSNNIPLQNKKIDLSLDDVEIILTTNKDGKFSFSNTIPSIGSILIESHFEGDAKYSSSTSSSTIYSFPKNTSSSLLLEIMDIHDRYNFEDYIFDIVIFQNSYDTIIKTISSDSAVLLDSKILLVSLPPGHDYFTEVYLDGRLFFVTDKERLLENKMLIQELKVPELATIKFKVTDDRNKPISDALISSWIYSSISGDDGFTDWISVLPTFTEREPYVAKITLPDQTIMYSDPFILFSGEQKIISIMTNDSIYPSQVPEWVKNSAGWWATGQIDDSSFVQGIQHLIQENIIQIPSVVNGASSDSNNIPEWVKNSAGWWATGQIDDSSFVQGIQHLIQEGIIVLP